MRNIKYLIYYDINNKEGREYPLATAVKADYIFRVLSNIGYIVTVTSSCLTSSKGYISGSRQKIYDNVELIKLPAFKWGNMLQKIIAYAWSKVGLFLYLVANTRKNEPVIVYHSLALMNVVKLAKKIKKFQLILETEEIYNDVINTSSKNRQKEINFLSCADKYIFPTELLNEKINKAHKPYCIIHGTYQVEKDMKVSFNDGKIHVIYAGTFDPRKGGALTTTTTKWLPENYHVHIIGFGSDEDTRELKQVIEETNANSKATVTYDGMLSGEEYIRFLQKCHIGMSTQNPDADFNDTSFPSKILSYMANGLRVVTVRIPAIECSAIGQDMYYYDKQKPEVIAKAIMDIDFNDGYDGRKKIMELDKQFKENLRILLQV